MLRSIKLAMTLVYGSSNESLRRSDVDGFVQVANGARTIWLDGGHNLHHDARPIPLHASLTSTVQDSLSTFRCRYREVMPSACRQRSRGKRRTKAE